VLYLLHNATQVAVATSDVMPYVATTIVALTGVFAAVTAHRLNKAKQEQEAANHRLEREKAARADQIAGVETSVTSLQRALERADTENTRLRQDVDRLTERLDKVTTEFTAHRAECDVTVRSARETIRRLADQIRALGGVPDVNGGS
jgi:septal ring factor EnvC (AmiA/AmiB activator)